MAKDKCITCGKETGYDFETHIDMRYGYIEGLGQCCKKCYDTNHITVSREEILYTPNDFELGKKIRNRFYETKNIR